MELDTTNLNKTLAPQELDAHERYGAGESYQFGVTRCELYHGLGETPPVVRLRMPGGILVFSDVSQVTVNTEGGVLIDCARQGQKPHCSINITRSGEIAFLYSPPPPPARISENGIARNIKGQEYRQSMIEVEGTAEGVRVQVQGTVDAAPRLVDSKNQRSPLTFFLIEEDPKHPDNPVYHEVWAVNKPKAELKALKLVKGSAIEVILYRHTYEIELENHEKQIYIRHNLVKVISTGSNGRGHSAKRQKRE